VTKLLIHGEEVITGATFFDSSQVPVTKTVTKNGNATQSPTKSKFNGWSWYFQGIGDYLSVPASPDFLMGTDPFTVEFWVNMDELTGPLGTQQAFLSSTPANNFDFSFAEEQLRVLIQSKWFVFPWKPKTNTWYHVAVVREGNKLKAFVDGDRLGTRDIAVSHGTNGGLQFGRYANAVEGFRGYLDEIRISRGVARWSSRFFPPIAAYPN